MMNERIQELAIKAGGGPSRWYTDPNVLEYFAELLINECLDVLNPEGDLTSMREEYGRINAMNMIKEHFGIE